MKVEIVVAGKKYQGETRWAHYQGSGENSLTLFSEYGSPLITPTVALWPPAPMAGEDEVWLKTWASSEGLPEQLAAAGVVELTEEYHATGHSLALRATLTEASMAEIRERYDNDPTASAHRDSARKARALEPGALRP